MQGLVRVKRLTGQAKSDDLSLPAREPLARRDVGRSTHRFRNAVGNRGNVFHDRAWLPAFPSRPLTSIRPSVPASATAP